MDTITSEVNKPTPFIIRNGKKIFRNDYSAKSWQKIYSAMVREKYSNFRKNHVKLPNPIELYQWERELEMLERATFQRKGKK
jgi:hypothetical protein